MQMLADIFIVKVPYLKASEILLFFYKFKSGDLGELYGSVDPLKLSTSLNEFLKWRSFELDKVYQRQREEKRRLDIENSKINGHNDGRSMRESIIQKIELEKGQFDGWAEP